MNKKAGIDTVFSVMDAVDGVKKVKNTYNNSTNKYDSLMGTTISKNISQKNGLNNAAISGKLASEELDFLCKQAGIKIPNRSDMARIANNVMFDAKKGIKNVSNKIENIDKNNTEHLKNMMAGIKGKDIKGALKEGLKASKVTLPAGLGMLGAGALTTKTMKDLDKDRNPEKDLEYNTIGTGVSAALLLNAMHNKRMLKPASVMANVVGDKMMKYPLRVIKKNSKAGKIVVDVAGQVNKKIRSKKASDELNDLEKLAKIDAEFGKKLFKEHFLERGKESIPYYAAPAALSFMLGRNLRRGFEKEPKKKDDSEKIAQFSPKFKITPKMEDGIKMNLEKGAEGLGRTIFPAAVMAVTGRDITNSFGKLKDNDNMSTRQNDMANKIVIQINGDDTKRKIKKDVSRQLDSALSKQAGVLNNVSESIPSNIAEINKIKIKKPIIGNGIKKSFRMQK